MFDDNQVVINPFTRTVVKRLDHKIVRTNGSPENDQILINYLNTGYKIIRSTTRRGNYTEYILEKMI
jgi:hypothetical protein